MVFERSSGVLLHPISLPGKYGIGDLGPDAYLFVDHLSDSGVKLWQVLPLGPTGYGDSPYQCLSAFAGNPYLISPEILVDLELLTPVDLENLPVWGDRIDYGEIFQWKPKLLRKAFEKFGTIRTTAKQFQDYEEFCRNEADWLDNYSLYMAIKTKNSGIAWNKWEINLRERKQGALREFIGTNFELIEEQKFLQYTFTKQWMRLKEYANQKGIKIIGDLPIFVAYDSADVWSAPELFHLRPDGEPTVVSGVPPDYFSATGQLWGNPLFKWDEHAKTGFAWWKRRMQKYLALYNFFRIDHFRGFSGYWEVPYGEQTAVKGRWVAGPGIEFFNSLQKELGDLPIIAEDLGEITQDVVELRNQLGFPGMKILQFAFSDPENQFLPHHYLQNCVVYTGSHDNDTIWGWYENASEKEKDFYHTYTQKGMDDVPGDMIVEIWKSVAVFAIVPMQDLLGQGSESRMNYPGKAGGYWSWRMTEGQFNESLVRRLKQLNYLYSR